MTQCMMKMPKLVMVAKLQPEHITEDFCTHHTTAAVTQLITAKSCSSSGLPGMKVRFCNKLNYKFLNNSSNKTLNFYL